MIGPWVLGSAIAGAGGLGALTRYGLGRLFARRFGSTVPWATFAINVTGSFLLGVATTLALNQVLPADWKAIVGTGFLGGYTTFSTASTDAVNLLRTAGWKRAVSFALGMFLVAVVAAAAGMAVGTMLAAP
jgi:fluoride exporter